MTRQLSLLHSCATEARNLAKRFSLCIVKQRLQLLATNICRKKTLFRRKPHLIFVILSPLRRKLRPPPPQKKNADVIYEQPLNPIWFASFLYSALSLRNSWERLSRCAVRVCLRLCRFLLLRAVLPHLSHLFCRRRGGGANGGSTPLFALSFSFSLPTIMCSLRQYRWL